LNFVSEEATKVGRTDGSSANHEYWFQLIGEQSLGFMKRYLTCGMINLAQCQSLFK